MIFRLYYKRLGGHVHCRLFAGPQEGALGKCGDLVFRHEEFTSSPASGNRWRSTFASGVPRHALN